MPDDTTHSAYARVYRALLEAADHLETLKQEGAETGVEPHAGAALAAVRLASAVLFPTVPCQTPPWSQDTDRLLDLCVNWRDAAFEVGEFAREADLCLVQGGEDR
ncbi:hypothetical protein PYK79_30245 [Streptomyces sp. ID05-04B]|uniref:hypothetical protein n=1 Tax=unclassified Streptomyces TaxID=2593676 RepID=UPI000D1B1566|nr:MULTISPECIES: hypothetical protein [unclassified Streptomyces]AVV41169.1 hypothetical protein C6376_06640 [Streptomyces sp. P3]MDX5566684.1 hypothetical protein [Streptomyces sp. ID05-04B]